MSRRTLLITVVLIMLTMALGVTSVLGCEFRLSSELIAGQHHDAGRVDTWYENGHLSIHVKPWDGWVLDETHLYVGENPPAKAAPGQFPYAGMQWYQLPLTSAPTCSDPIYVALHAVVTKDGESETAWADSYGIPFDENKGWAMYLAFPSGPLCP